MAVRTVTDPDDPVLADYTALTDPVRRRRVESERGFFIAESRLVVTRLLSSPYPVRSVLLTPEGLDAMGPVLGGLAAPVYVIGRELARRITGFDVHRGVLASASRLALPRAADLARRSRTVLVLEQIADQVNMGALFRNGLGLGADAVLLSPGCCDPLYRRSVRVSMGASLALPFSYLDPWPAALADLSALGFELLALTPDPGATSVRDLVGRPERVGLLLGAEGPGLTAAARSRADREVRIPMRPGADSLNVATAAAIALDRLGPG